MMQQGQKNSIRFWPANSYGVKPRTEEWYLRSCNLKHTIQQQQVAVQRALIIS